jgi:glycosyltransferase involved in cell wall biosynthesis
MKILQVLPALQMGGVERGTIEIARALQREGIENLVASQGGPMVAELDALGVRHIALPLKSKNPFVMWRNARALADFATREGVTLMHVRSRAPAWSVKWASQRCGVPWMATYHGVYGTKPEFFKKPYNHVMLEGVKTICVSDYVYRHVLETYHPDPAKLIRIHRGADTDVFRPDEKLTAAAREEKTTRFGFEPDCPLITLPGRLTRWKGQEVLLAALGKMKAPKLGALFVGSDQGRSEYTAQLRAQAAALGARVRVVFQDHARDMARIYAMSDIVVNASSAQPEAFGRTIPEAQAMGTLVVATRHGGACETIRDGETGFLVPPGDAVALAETLDRVLALDTQARRRIQDAARASVHDSFSIEKMCAQTLAVYRALDQAGQQMHV